MDTIETIVLEVINEYPIKRVAFFGSAAPGDMTAGSDIGMMQEI